MLRRVDNRWISDTKEGTFTLTSEEAYFEISIQMLDILKQAESNGEQADIDGAKRARALYDASLELNVRQVFFGEQVRKSIMPLLDALSKDYQAPRTCEIIACYAIREMWKRVTHQQDTDMLWELFSFYRDRIMPLVLRDRPEEIEQYARIVRAFYRMTGTETSQYGVPFCSIINNSFQKNISYSEAYSQYSEELKGKNTYNDKMVTGRRAGVCYELIYIPKILADKAIELNKKGIYLSDAQKLEYLVVKKGAILAEKIANTTDDMVHDVMYDSDLDQFYKECMEKEWYGFCYTVASLQGLNSERKRIASQVGNYSVYDIDKCEDVTAGFVSILVNIAIPIVSICTVAHFAKNGHYLIDVLAVLGFVYLQNIISKKATHALKNQYAYRFFLTFSIMTPVLFLIRRYHFFLVLITIIMFYMIYKYNLYKLRNKNTTAFMVSCSMAAVLPCIMIYYNHMYTGIVAMLCSYFLIYTEN